MPQPSQLRSALQCELPFPYLSGLCNPNSYASAFGATMYTAGIPDVISDFNVSYTVAILPFSLYFLGIAFAPITTPHLSERLGRSRVYLISLPLFSLFILGAGLSKNMAGLAVCRFFAGFFGGPCLVLIEGTFADIWSAKATVSYYSVLTLASYIGAGAGMVFSAVCIGHSNLLAGPLVGGFVVAAKGWRWTQWVTLMVALAAYLLGIGIPETYNRAIMIRRAKRLGLPAPKLMEAGSGVTLTDMSRITLFTPLKMLVAEPIVTAISLYLGFNFAIIFSFFISIPVVLNLTYMFTLQQAGLAFNAAIVGSLLAAATSIIIDRLISLKLSRKCSDPMMNLEYRLIPAMIGGIGMTASFFWIAWTASPTINWPSPVIGTLLYVWGNMSILVSDFLYTQSSCFE